MRPKFVTGDQSTETFHVFMEFLIVLPTPSLHIEMFMHCMSYTNNRTCQIAYTVSILVPKYAKKIINFLSKRRVRWSTELFWLKKLVPTSKKFEKRCTMTFNKVQKTQQLIVIILWHSFNTLIMLNTAKAIELFTHSFVRDLLTVVNKLCVPYQSEAAKNSRCRRQPRR